MGKAEGVRKKKQLDIKQLVQLPLEEQQVVAQFGIDYDHGAVFLASELRLLGQNFDEQSVVALFKSNDARVRIGLQIVLIPALARAAVTGDGSFFRHLAEAVERAKQPLDTVRALITRAAYCQPWGKHHEENRDITEADFLTAAEWCSHLEKVTGKQIDPVVFRRMAKAHGLKLKRDKQGRKPLAKLKSKNPD